jgi:hypothetical protein
VAALSKPCKKCRTVHAERFFIGRHHVTVRVEPNLERTSKMSNAKAEEEEEEE